MSKTQWHYRASGGEGFADTVEHSESRGDKTYDVDARRDTTAQRKTMACGIEARVRDLSGYSKR